MTKQAIKLSIDEEILKIAKREIPNLSSFFQQCLELYINTNHEEFELQKLSRTISEANFKRELLFKSQLDKKYEEQDLIAEQNHYWTMLYGSYLHNNSTEWELMKKCIEILGQSEEVLISMMDTLKYEDSAEFDKLRTLTDWRYTVGLFEDVE